MLQSKVIDDKTSLTFQLYDDRYRELYPSKQYQVHGKIKLENFHLSHDEKYLIIKTSDSYFYLCYFENGFEDDIFIERKFGQESLDKMILTNFLFDTRYGIGEYQA